MPNQSGMPRIARCSKKSNSFNDRLNLKKNVLLNRWSLVIKIPLETLYMHNYDMFIGGLIKNKREASLASWLVWLSLGLERASA
jgi:hypothetical protein